MSVSSSFLDELEDAVAATGSACDADAADAGAQPSDASNDGTLTNARDSDATPSSSAQPEFSECAHLVIFEGLCAICGVNIEEAREAVDPGAAQQSLHTPVSKPKCTNPGSGEPTMDLQYLGGISVKAQYWNAHQQDMKSRLLRDHKLGLVLDLDHTLLHTKPKAGLSHEEASAIQRRLEEQKQRGTGEKALLYDLPECYTKLRPGVFQFLAAMRSKFHLFIYTMGDERYACSMASILDPKGELFKNRVICRTDSNWETCQKGLDKVCAADMAVVVDDTPGVWQQDAQNLLAVQRYFYFSSPNMSPPGGAPAAVRVLEGTDEDARSNELACVARVLSTLHEQFYSPMNGCRQDARLVLAAIRGGILMGVGVVFSRVMVASSTPCEHPLWKLARDLGASCSEHIADSTTHVVSLADNTEKCRQARKRRLKLVNPDWLLACDSRWTRVDEHPFPAPSTEGSFAEWAKQKQAQDAMALAALTRVG